MVLTAIFLSYLARSVGETRHAARATGRGWGGRDGRRADVFGGTSRLLKVKNSATNVSASPTRDFTIEAIMDDE